MPARESLGDGTISLLSEISMAMVRADAMYAHVPSSDQCSPGAIQGMFTMNPRTISGDRFRFVMRLRARSLQCAESLLDNADAVGMKSADAAIIEMNKKADCLRTNCGV